MNGKLHDVYHLINKDTGLPLPGTGSPWPTVAQFEAHALNTVAGEEKYTVDAWTLTHRTQPPIPTEEQAVEVFRHAWRELFPNVLEQHT